MWESEFDISDIKPGETYIINCPTEQLERELAFELDMVGLHYPDGMLLSSHCHWKEYEEDFCYYIYKNSVVRRGGKPDADGFNGIKCTFYGVKASEFETATDMELRSFLGV